ncbi:MAG: ATP-binding cassette domain-containing protein [Gemmatimonadaceae bacterium]
MDALLDASITVSRGTVHALLGENGAGKSTLMRVAFGMVQPDAGTIAIDGAPARLSSAADAIARGVGMVHQHFTVVPAMTVAENVSLGGRGRYDSRTAAERVRAIGRETGLELDPGAMAGSLPVSAQQRLETVKALARGARTLIMDEPTAVLAPGEASELMAFLRRYVAGGGAVVLITHKLREALQVADEVTVLRRGRTAMTVASSAATVESLADAMIGDSASVAATAPPRSDDTSNSPASRNPTIAHAIDAAPSPAPTIPFDARVIARAERLAVPDERGALAVREATLDVRAGEIVGIVGVEGSGHRELLRAFAGLAAPAGGSISLPARIAFIPEDRHRDALALDLTVAENVAMRGVARAHGVMGWREIAARTQALLTRFDVRGGRADSTMRALSGGNQQKLVLARELHTEPEGAPELVIAENPTRGLDIAATVAVHRQILAVRDRGGGVVVYSSDVDEVLALADRVVAMFAGGLREVPRDRAEAGRAMLGV